MNDPISWDPSLVKKYSASNHFKLLNQLRNEVKKYPLNNKTNSTSIDKRDYNNESKSKLNNHHSQSISISKNQNLTKNNINNKSTVSFNNSKNFSIYNNVSNDSNTQENENIIVDKKRSINNSLSSTFNDRLNQIDLK